MTRKLNRLTAKAVAKSSVSAFFTVAAPCADLFDTPILLAAVSSDTSG
jgi:hypothetical protein